MGCRCERMEEVEVEVDSEDETFMPAIHDRVAAAGGAGQEASLVNWWLWIRVE